MVSDIYNKVAASYDSNGYPEKYHKGRDVTWQEELLLNKVIRNTPCTNFKTALDICCGDGSLYTKYLSTHGCIVTGVDISKTMIKHASLRIPTANFLCCNFLDDRVPIGNSYDIITCIYGLFHFFGDDYKRAIQRIYRLLKSGGVALINVRKEEYDGIKEAIDWFGKPMWWYLPGIAHTLHICTEIGFLCQVYECVDNHDYVYVILHK